MRVRASIVSTSLLISALTTVFASPFPPQRFQISSIETSADSHGMLRHCAPAPVLRLRVFFLHLPDYWHSFYVPILGIHWLKSCSVCHRVTNSTWGAQTAKCWGCFVLVACGFGSVTRVHKIFFRPFSKLHNNSLEPLGELEQWPDCGVRLPYYKFQFLPVHHHQLQPYTDV